MMRSHRKPDFFLIMAVLVAAGVLISTTVQKMNLFPDARITMQINHVNQYQFKAPYLALKSEPQAETISALDALNSP